MRRNEIVEEFISMWPREVCDIKEPGKRKLFVREFAPLQKPGVYVLYRDETPYYIGRAGLLRKRIWAHANRNTDRYYNFWNFFSAFIVSDTKYLTDVEKILIAAMPTANSSTPKMNKIPMPATIVARIRSIRRHDADPVTRKDFAALQRFLRHLGAISGPGDLSSRRGFSKH